MRGEKSGDVIIEAAFAQVQLAIEAADVIMLVVNVREGIVPLDREVAQRLRRAGKKVLVAVNKADNEADNDGADEFSALGFQAIFPVSAIHQRGIDALMTAALASLPAVTAEGATPEAEAEPPLKLAVVGRPNVGKSSLINALTHSERVIVTPIPGTTRDAVDVPFEVETGGVRQKYILIDTAGVRQERRVRDSVEFFSIKRTEDSIARSDIVIFVLDAEAGIFAQDKKVADKIIEERKACVVVINKWDLVTSGLERARRELNQREEKRREGQRAPLTSLADFGNWVREQLFFLDYAPVIFTSAKSGFHLEQLLESIRYVAAQLRQKVPTAILNRTLNDAIAERQPVSSAGHRLKFFYATQIKQSPPMFLLFVNRADLFSDQYKKYLSNQMRKAFGYEGCPLVLAARSREKTITPIRKHRPRKNREQGKRTARKESGRP